ncbi:MAG: ParB/Srx family N-terminal domain-containing protein [Spirochaetota bacterium]
MNIEYSIKLIPIKDIELDKSNPRIAQFLEFYGDDIPSEQIALALGVGDSQTDGNGVTFQSLKTSIKTNGGIIHPIIVNDKSDKKYVVIEGNTRLAIYKEFHDKKIPGKWDKILSIVYKAMTPEEIDAIRLQSHLVGPRAWDPYSKAKYLEYLRNSEHLTMNQIIDFCGGRKKEVEDYIEAYLVMENEYKSQLESDSDFDPSRFSAFVELQRTPVKKAIVDANFTFKDFAKWVIDLKFKRLEDVRKLPVILPKKESREIFIKTKGKDAVQKALDAIAPPQPTDNLFLLNAKLEQLAKELSNKIMSMQWSESQKLRDERESAEVQDLFDARDQLIELCKFIES